MNRVRNPVWGCRMLEINRGSAGIHGRLNGRRIIRTAGWAHAAPIARIEVIRWERCIHNGQVEALRVGG